MTTNNRNNITNAPSKFHLSVCIFDKSHNTYLDGRHPVQFKIEGPDFSSPVEISVIINQIKWADGSGESWFFEGYTLTRIPGTPTEANSQVNGWFQTTDRKGWIDFWKKEKIQQETIDVKLLTDIFTDAAVLKAFTVGPISESFGSFQRFISICPNQGCVFEGQTLSADWDETKKYWKVFHPNC